MLTCTCMCLKCVLHLVAALGDQLLSPTLYAINVTCNLILTVLRYIRFQSGRKVDVRVRFHMYHVNGDIRLENLKPHNKRTGPIIFEYLAVGYICESLWHPQSMKKIVWTVLHLAVQARGQVEQVGSPKARAQWAVYTWMSCLYLNELSTNPWLTRYLPFCAFPDEWVKSSDGWRRRKVGELLVEILTIKLTYIE